MAETDKNTDFLSPELFGRIKAIQIRTQRLVTDALAGDYESAFKGRGMEFEEVRAYIPGDDVRHIDWKVTARTGVPHVKEHREEREMTVMLLVDVSSSGAFGTVAYSIIEVLADGIVLDAAEWPVAIDPDVGDVTLSGSACGSNGAESDVAKFSITLLAADGGQ